MSSPSLGNKLTNPPTDGITRVQFAPGSNSKLLVTGWDKTLRVYDVNHNALLASHGVAAPILDAAWGADGTVIYSGAVDGAVRRHDATTGAETLLGQHSKAVKAIATLPDHHLVVSGSWDHTLRVFDTRATPPSACVACVELPGKVFAAAASDTTVVVATSNRRLMAFDAANGAALLMEKESPLKYQTRCVACFPSGGGVAMGSVEGRVAIDSLGSATVKPFAFKCHRATKEGQQVVYPVNALAFHPSYGTFATGGSDGAVAVWDAAHQKRLAQWTGYPSSVASLAFAHDGSRLAVASSYLYEQGAEGVGGAGDEVFVREVSDAEVAPRQKKQ